MTDPQPSPHRERRIPPAVHPFWCDDCGRKAPFTIRGCEIPHESDCSRAHEDAERVYVAAVEWCKRTGEAIP